MKTRFQRTLFPDICFAQGENGNLQNTLLPRGIWWQLLLTVMWSFNLSAQFSFYASGLICVWIIALAASQYNFKPEQQEYLKTIPFSPWDYALGRFLWSVLFGLVSTAAYILVFWLMRESLSLSWALGETLSFARILGFGLVHFGLVVLSFSLTTLLRTWISRSGMLWILIALIIGVFALIYLDYEAYLFGRLYIDSITFPVSLLILLALLVLTAACYWGVTRRQKHWAIPDKSSRWKRMLIGVAVAITAVLVCVLLPKAGQYHTPVDEHLTPEAQYQVALDCLEDEDIYGAAVSFYACGDYADARERCWEMWGKIAPRKTIIVSANHVLALTNDGTFLTTDSEGADFPMVLENIPEPHRLISIHYGGSYLAGLYDNGSVGLWGELYGDGEQQIAQWTDIVGLFTGGNYVIGLKADGTVVASGHLPENTEEDLLNWKDLVGIGKNDRRLIGIHADGTMSPSHTSRDGAVLFLQGAKAAGMGNVHTAILREDGTVTSLGHGGWTQINTQDWTDIVAIEVGWYCTVGLRSDGTVLMAGGLFNAREFLDREAVAAWTDIVDVAISGKLLVGLRADGTLVATGDTELIQEALAWEGIRLPG